MELYEFRNLKELFEMYASSDFDFVKEGIQNEIQKRLDTAFNQLDKCRTKEEALQVYDSFLDI